MGAAARFLPARGFLGPSGVKKITIFYKMREKGVPGSAIPLDTFLSLG
jgi:hypothetical protein